MTIAAKTTQLERKFVPEDLEIREWEDIKPYFESLEDREIGSLNQYKHFLRDLSELEAVVAENAGWRYIKSTVDTSDEEASNEFRKFIRDIQPEIAPFEYKLGKKVVHSRFASSLTDNSYQVYLRGITRQIQMFREENIPLKSKIEETAQEYGTITGAMTIAHNGEEMTLPQAGKLLEENDRALREEIYRKVQARRLEDEEKLDGLLDELIALRQKVAKNVGYDNYRDYKHDELGRFDYKVEDTHRFADSIAHVVVPIAGELAEERKNNLGVDTLRPWDMGVDEEGKPPLKPFDTAEELTEKTIEVFNKLDPYFGECLATMNERGYLDLASKLGKAPGGYNYPLFESGIPFIFMNSVGTMRDMVTLMHEGGHALHSFLSAPLELTEFKSTPSEVAELASMSMELFSMDHWDVFFDNEEELKRAKRKQLKDVLGVLPWIATIDKFQHWLYTHAGHSPKQRKDYWLKLSDEFGVSLVDYSGLEKVRANMWMKQLHIFEVPFYYIEYGMAQLGAIALWRNFKQERIETLKHYKKALSMGYTAPIGVIYETAGIRFDFSEDYVRDLMEFVKGELEQLEN